MAGAINGYERQSNDQDLADKKEENLQGKYYNFREWYMHVLFQTVWCKTKQKDKCELAKELIDIAAYWAAQEYLLIIFYN